MVSAQAVLPTEALLLQPVVPLSRLSDQIGPMTVKLFGSVAVWPSGFVTTTFHKPAAMPVRLARHLMESPSDSMPVAVTSPCPARVNFTVAPSKNCVPVRFNVTLPPLPEFGVTPLRAGRAPPPRSSR